MNQRIRELAYRADLVIKKSNGNDFRFGAMDPKLEKFAELIVRECAAYAFSDDQDHKIMLNHFGVEE